MAGRILLSQADSVGERIYEAVFGYESVKKMGTKSVNTAFNTQPNRPHYVSMSISVLHISKQEVDVS